MKKCVFRPGEIVKLLSGVNIGIWDDPCPQDCTRVGRNAVDGKVADVHDDELILVVSTFGDVMKFKEVKRKTQKIMVMALGSDKVGWVWSHFFRRVKL